MCLFIVVLLMSVVFVLLFFFFKQKTAYEMRISDWSSDVCSSDLPKRGVPMSVVPLRTEARSRGVRMLRTALGVSVAGWLDDPATIAVMLNPDGRLWIDRLGEGVSDTGERRAAADGERVIRLVAPPVGVDVKDEKSGG